MEKFPVGAAVDAAQLLMSQEVHGLGEIIRQFEGGPTAIVIAIAIDHDGYKVATYHPAKLSEKEGWAFAATVRKMLDAIE